MDLLTAGMLAIATIATAWCGYQSSQWSGRQTEHRSKASTAVVRTAKFANLAMQRIGVHINLFSQWAAATSARNTALADFLYARFPEPLKAATAAWQKTDPLRNAASPATPFDMPEYALSESAETDHWEGISLAETEAADRASEMSSHYLVFTIVFASVLFFGGISGKFRWPALDVAMLVLGGLVLLIGIVIMLSTPRA